jgi:hypothetical protein
MVLYNGRWIGPKTSSGAIDDSIINEIVAIRAGTVRPKYLRLTNVDAGAKAVPAADSQEMALVKKLLDADIRLGVAIGALHGGTDDTDCVPTTGSGKGKKADKCVLTPADVIAKAAELKKDSDAAGGIFDWIFLDFAWTRTPASHYGLDDLQEIVDGMAKAGWDRIMINGTGFGEPNFQYIPERTWAVARHFHLFESSSWKDTVSQVAAGHTDPLQSSDKDFASYVTAHRAGTIPVMKLEVPTQAQQFRTVSQASQLSLLTDWARECEPIKARMIYPLYIDGTKPISNQANQYDSLKVGTFWQQRELMYQYG